MEDDNVTGGSRGYVHDHNQGKCAQDVLQSDLEDIRPRSAHESADTRIWWALLEIGVLGLFIRVYRANVLSKSKDLSLVSTRKEIYRAMNNLGTVRDFAF